MVVAFRRHALLPLDDCLYALQPTISRLTHSSLHRYLERHGISRLPAIIEQNIHVIITALSARARRRIREWLTSV